MYKRYQGNSGRVTRVDETPRPPAAPSDSVRQEPPPMPMRSAGRPSRPPTPAPPFSLSFLQELETEDLLMLLILYLLYRESGDRDLLIIIGALLFL